MAAEIIDWDDAYINAAYIPDGNSYADRWATDAAAFRAQLPEGCEAEFDIRYGSHERQMFDVIRPPGASKGLSIFVHGGYWMRFSKNDWTHLASGALARGWTVALPGYRLCPDVSIAAITQDIAAAIETLSMMTGGPLRLAGHSAGGHLAARMICIGSPLPIAVAQRIEHVIAISGLNDLRPFMRTKMNEVLHLTEDMAITESPALLQPVGTATITCWAGSNERPEFLRQNDLLADCWNGACASIESVHAAGRHHFDVIADLQTPDSRLAALLAP